MSLAFLAVALVVIADPTIDDVVQKSLKSASFTTVIESAKQSELQKINNDFAQTYRFKSMDVWMKEPFMIRMESKVDDSEILMVINGAVRKISIPKARLSQKFNLAKQPGKRQTVMDFGLLTPALFDGLFDAVYVRTERKTGEYVYDVTYVPSLKDKSRHRVWVDPERRFMLKRQWYANRGGHLMATFDYSDPVQLGGVWFPTRISVTNADGALAGTTVYRGLKVNGELADDLFKTG